MRNAAHIGIGLILASLVLAACSSKGSEGATALWVIDTAAPPATTADSFVAMVTRLGCSGGKTGEVLEPTLVFSEDEVVVTFSVEPFEGDAACPGNDEVPYVVDLGQPLGDRQLVDGACLAGEAVFTSFCSDGPIRWMP